MNYFSRILSASMVFLVSLIAPCIEVGAVESIERSDLATIFKRQNVEGTFVLFDLSKDSLVLVNASRATARKFPASTFKVANSLIALETGVIMDQNEIIPYGGKSQPIKIWEHDMSMKDAIKI